MTNCSLFFLAYIGSLTKEVSILVYNLEEESTTGGAYIRKVRHNIKTTTVLHELQYSPFKRTTL